MKRATISIAWGVALLLAAAGCKGGSKTEEKEETTPAEAEETEPTAETEAEEKEEPAAEVVRITDAGFETPESVLHDPEADVYLVSNIVGSPLEEDGKAFISRVSPDGEVETLKWIDGEKEGVTLNAPKGMAISGNLLYVADISVVRKFDRDSGEPKGEVKIKGATFLNDVASGSDGAVYVSDSGLKAGEGGFAPSGSDAIYRIGEKGKAKKMVADDELGRPNGLAVDGEAVWVVTFAQPGQLYKVTADGKMEGAVETPKGQLDGLVSAGDEVLFSSWEGKSVFRGRPAGPFEEIIAGVESPADIGYDAERARVLIPLFTENAVEIHPLPEAAEAP